MITERHCQRCAAKTRQEVSMRLSASKAEHYGWRCLTCKGWALSKEGGYWIPKNKLIEYGLDLTLVPLVEQMDAPRCARCGQRGAEEHHWAPRAMFGADCADLWPKDYLCKSCHDEWHRVVTPSLVKDKPGMGFQEMFKPVPRKDTAA